MDDNDELLTVYDAAGQSIGIKPRSAVHRDGDWHKLVFVWAARLAADESIQFLLQIRSRKHDCYWGHIDALAGGHVSARETCVECAVRELGEEAAIVVEQEELQLLGSRRLENPSGVCRRVFEDLYLCSRPLQLSDLGFTHEANGFLEVDMGELEEMIDGKRDRVGAMIRREADGGTIRSDEDNTSERHHD